MINFYRKVIFVLKFWILPLLFIGNYYPCEYNNLWFANLPVKYIALALLLVLFFFQRKKYFIDKTFVFITILWSFLFLFRYYIIGEEVAIESFNSILVTIILIKYICQGLNNTEIINYLIKTHIVMIVLCVVGLILLIIGINLPELSRHEINDNEIIHNFGLFFMKSHNIVGVNILDYIRPAGFYDEPGSFAFMIFLMLAINRLCNNNNKRIEQILIWGGLITLSLAHMVIITLYYLFFYANRKSLFWIVFSVIIIFALYKLTISSENSYLASMYNMSFGRLDEFMSGKDTSRNFSASYLAFNEFFWNVFGTSMEEIKRTYPQATPETLYYFLARMGIGGTFIYSLIFMFPFIRSIKEKNWEVLKIILLLMINFVQRPYLQYPIILFSVYILFYYSYSYKLRNI